MKLLAGGAALQPLDVLTRWPRQMPFACVLAGDSAARWSILAEPHGEPRDFETIFNRPPTSPTPPTFSPDRATEHTLEPGDVPPFDGGWIGAIAYEAGWELDDGLSHQFRRGMESQPPRCSNLPRSIWLRCDDALIYDHAKERWWVCGEGGKALWNQVEEARNQSASTAQNHLDADAVPSQPMAYRVAPIEPEGLPSSYCEKVQRALSYIRDGDAYQVNLAHTMKGTFSGCALTYFVHRCEIARPRYGAFICFDEPGPHPAPHRHVVASLSPELFLEYEPAHRKLTTKPMKGTRSSGIDPNELIESQKDHAELAMIVDLMRNDLGAISKFGTVKVEQARAIEHHGSDGAGGVVQTTATISGTLREGLTLFDALKACFPCGSVTGAPKARAMQIIEELEDSPRGFYCGSMGYLSDSGAMRLNVAIRTIHLQGTAKPGTLHAYSTANLEYKVGAGIVAESNPQEEWAETLVKAGVVQSSRAERTSGMTR